MNTEDQTTDIALSEDQETAQVEIIVSASLANIQSNREKLEEVATQYKGIKIDGIDDKANYKIVSAGITATRSGRTTVAKLVKGGKSLLDKAKKRLDEEGEALISIVSGVEQELKTEKERIDTLKQEAEDELLRLEEEKKQARIAKLFELGLKFNGAYYEIGDLNITSIQVIQYSEAQFEGFVSQATVAYEAEQLRLAEEQEERLRKEEAERKQREEMAENIRKQQEALELENAQKQAALDAARREQDIMRIERAEHRMDVLRSKGFEGDLKLGHMFYGTAYKIKAATIVDSNKAEWNEVMQGVEVFLEKLSKPAPTILPSEDIKPVEAPKNGHAIKFTEEQRESILNDVLVAEEAVKSDTIGMVTGCLYFTDDKPFVDTMIGKSTLRIYVEQTLDAAQDGLTPEMVAASGSIGDELLFLVIKGK